MILVPFTYKGHTVRPNLSFPKWTVMHPLEGKGDVPVGKELGRFATKAAACHFIDKQPPRK